MRADISRRSFVLIGGALIAVPVFGAGCSKEEDILAARALVETLSREPGVAPLRAAGAGKPSTIPQFVSRLRALGPSSWFWEKGMSFPELLHQVIRDEFSRNRVVQRDGWIVSETEAELFAMAGAGLDGAPSGESSDAAAEEAMLNASDEGDE